MKESLKAFKLLEVYQLVISGHVKPFKPLWFKSFNWRQLISFCFIKGKVTDSSLVLPKEEDEEHIENCPARYSI